MKRLLSIAALTALLVLALGSPSAARATSPAAAAGQRLVVFEGFYNPG